MARRPSIPSLERRVAESRKREAALARRQKAQPRVGTGGRRSMESYTYNSLFTTTNFTVLAPEAGVTFFGGAAALGLDALGTEPALPRGFKPAKIRATVSIAAPTTATSALSGRRYLKYTAAAGGTTRNSYSSPLSADTSVALVALFRAVATAKKAAVGEYGRIWFEPERPIYVVSGDRT